MPITIQQLSERIAAMLLDAEAKYQDAAAMHHMGKVANYGGEIVALKRVIALIKG